MEKRIYRCFTKNNNCIKNNRNKGLNKTETIFNGAERGEIKNAGNIKNNRNIPVYDFLYFSTKNMTQKNSK